MNTIILGAAGFIGTNLTIKLAENIEDRITIAEHEEERIEHDLFLHHLMLQKNLQRLYIEKAEDGRIDKVCPMVIACKLSNQHIDRQGVYILDVRLKGGPLFDLQQISAPRVLGLHHKLLYISKRICRLVHCTKPYTKHQEPQVQDPMRHAISDILQRYDC